MTKKEKTAVGQLVAGARAASEALRRDATWKLRDTEAEDDFSSTRAAQEAALHSLLFWELADELEKGETREVQMREAANRLIKERDRAASKARPPARDGGEGDEGEGDDAPPAAARCRHEWTPPGPDGAAMCSKCGAAKGKRGRPSNASRGLATVDGVTKEDLPSEPLPLPPAPPPAPAAPAARVGAVAADRFKDGPI